MTEHPMPIVEVAIAAPFDVVWHALRDPPDRSCGHSSVMVRFNRAYGERPADAGAT